MHHITDSMIEAVITPQAAKEILRSAFTAFDQKTAAMQQRERTEAGGVKLSTLGAVIPEQGVTGAKVYTTIAGKFNFVILLFSTDTGEPLATMEANAITRLRTAATTVLAAERLAPKEAQTLLLCGAGVQGQAHAQQIAEHYPLQQIYVYDPYVDEATIAHIADTCRVKTKRVVSTDAVSDAEIVITASRSKHPLFKGNEIANGAFVAAIGSSLPYTREIDDVALNRSASIVVEWRQQALQEAGDLVMAAPELHVQNKLVELGELLNGRDVIHPKGSQISLYKAVGVGLEDIALAGLAYRLINQ